MVKVENVVIGAIMVTAIFTSILVFYADLTSNYVVNNYYEENFTSYENMLSGVEDRSEEINEALNKLASNNLLDILGGLRQGVINALLIFKDSFIAIGYIFSQSIAVFGLGAVGATWIAISAVATLLIFLIIIIKKG